MISTQKLGRQIEIFVSCLLILGFGVLCLPEVQAIRGAADTILISQILLIAAVLATHFFRSDLGKLIIPPSIKKVHWVQALVHTSVYTYWGFYYFGIREHLPYIIYQLVFGNVFYFLASMALRRPYKIDFSIFPIVLSINLFIWFKHEYFYWQLLMVAGAVLGKMLIQREIKGRRAHIFNPSALVMFSVAVFAILLPIAPLFKVLDVVRSFALVPHFYIFLFIVGSITQWFGETTLVSMGAVATVLICDTLSKKIFGMPVMPSLLDRNVFLGMTLLITDPATSPKSKGAQFFFGSIYAMSVIFSFGLLSLFDKPEYYDKLLFIPLLNYLVPSFDKLADRLQSFSLKIKEFRPLQSKALIISLYGLLIFTFSPRLEKEHKRIPFLMHWSHRAYGTHEDPPIDPRLEQQLPRPSHE